MNELVIKEIKDSRTANAFLFANILNQLQSSKRSFEAPYILEERIGSIEPDFIINYPIELLIQGMVITPCIHPMANVMAERLVKASEILIKKY